MTVVDVGACHGLYVKGLREAVGPTGTVIAIEPQRDLVSGLVAAGASRVITAAAGDQTIATRIYRSAQYEHASLWLANVLESRGVAEDVPMVRLDDVIEQCDAIKIDAQGAEAAILHGAPRLLSVVRPIWYVEVWRVGLEQAGSSVADLCRRFREAGYVPDGADWATVEAEGLRNEGHSSSDVCVIPQERIAA